MLLCSALFYAVAPFKLKWHPLNIYDMAPNCFLSVSASVAVFLSWARQYIMAAGENSDIRFSDAL